MRQVGSTKSASVEASAGSAEALVEAYDVTKHYGSVVALESLDLAVRPGEILGVLGPNGAGKTSAIRVLTTILPPTRGTFGIAGIPNTRPAEIRRVVGVLPESAGYPERQTGAEYVRYFARLYGHGNASARRVTSSLLEQVGLAERGDSLIAGYSRGMRQRLGIARTLVNEPQVVFLDEPTLGLDPAGQRQVLALIRTIARDRGATVLLSTHLLAEVEEVCSRVLILNRGRVAAEGTVAEIARLAAAPRSARIRVDADQVARARGALRAAPGVQSVEVVDEQSGSLQATLDATGADDGNAGLRALVDAGVPLHLFELEGASLSDAFLAITEGS
jgi:ABC-2 type transport system ATP-binding protein